MGLYSRDESKYWWMALERPGQKAIRRSTKILVAATTPQQTKENRRLAEIAYHEAMANLAKLRLDLPDARAGVTVAEQAKWYAAHHVARHRGKARETVILAHLVRVLGTLDLRLIDRTTAQEYQTQRMGEGVGAATVNREMTVLKSLLNAAVPRLLRASPLAGFPRLRATVERKRMVRAEEERKLIKALTGETRDLYILAVDTLQRQQNVAHLQRRECRDGYLALEDSKTGPYTVPLSTRAAALVAARLKAAKPYLFPDWHRRFTESQPQASVELNRELRVAAEAAGIPTDGSDGRFSWHTATRATGATRMIAAGVNPRTVQMIGNWRSFDQMAQYLELDTAGGHDAVNQIASKRGKR
jgi:hypothetical protein